MELLKIKQLKEGFDMKKVYMGLICSLLFVSMAGAANIAVWYGTESSPQTYINSSGVIYAPSFVGAMTISDATISGNATVSGAITGATLKVTGGAIVGTLTTTAGNGLPWTNATAATTFSGWTNATASGTLAAVTNATVGGGVLSGVGVVVTNATITPASIVTNVTFTSQIITNVYDLQTNTYTIYTGAAMQTATLTLSLETGTPAVSTPTISLEKAGAAGVAVTLTPATGTPTVTLTPATGSFVKP